MMPQQPKQGGGDFNPQFTFNTQPGMPWAWTQKWVPACCFCVDLRLGAMIMAFFLFIADISLMGLSFSNYTAQQGVYDAWRRITASDRTGFFIGIETPQHPIISLIAGLVFLLLVFHDLVGLFATFKALPTFLKVYATLNWVRLILFFAFSVAVFYYSAVSIVFLIFWLLVQVFWQICTWSYYLDVVNNPGRYQNAPIKLFAGSADVEQGNMMMMKSDQQHPVVVVPQQQPMMMQPVQQGSVMMPPPAEQQQQTPLMAPNPQ
ncbi:hypothetical protein HDV05_007439 [Chytridiales sp. JEL 0842]|nr:hypothetical protein HDV05_007439 [Chytridiales sp. JEL 0842]